MQQAGVSAKVLVGVDGSEKNRNAVDWAVDEARRRGEVLVAAYAWHIPTFAYSSPYFVPISTGEMTEQGGKMLKNILTKAGADLATVDMRVVEGRATAVLHDLAGEAGVELVVVGSRGRGTTADLLLGSTSHALTHNCPKPLAVVPSMHDDSPPRPRVGHVVVGTDGSEGGDFAVSWAADEARRTDSLLEVVIAWTWTAPFFPLDADASLPIGDVLEKAAEETLAKTVERVGLGDLTVKLSVHEGAATDVLVKYSREADMLVVGRRGLGRTRELFLGSVSHGCTHRSEVPVVVVPGTNA